MSLLKRTYVLPRETLAEFEKMVSSGERSSLIARLMESWVEEQRREVLSRDIVEGCREMAEVYQDLEREFHPLEEEVERTLEG